MIRVVQALALIAAVTLPVAALAQKPSLNDPASLKEQAPATYKVRFDTSAGPFVVTVTRAWAPRGADRFYNLVKNGFFDDSGFSASSLASWCSSASMAIRRRKNTGRTPTSRTIR